jgi:hypothetical protein
MNALLIHTRFPLWAIYGAYEWFFPSVDLLRMNNSPYKLDVPAFTLLQAIANNVAPPAKPLVRNDLTVTPAVTMIGTNRNANMKPLSFLARTAVLKLISTRRLKKAARIHEANSGSDAA